MMLTACFDATFSVLRPVCLDKRGRQQVPDGVLELKGSQQVPNQ